MIGEARRSIWTGTSSLLAARAVNAMAGLASLTLLTRHLGAHGFGVFATATTFVALVAVIGDGGLPLLTVRELSEDGPDSGTYLRTQVRGRLLLSVGVGVVAAGLALTVFRREPAVAVAILVLLPALPCLAVGSTFASALQARLLVHRVAATGAVSRVVSLVGVALVVAADGGLVWCLAVTAACWIVQTALLWACLPHDMGRPAPERSSGDTFLAMLRRSAPLGAATLVNGVYFRVDAVMVALIAGVSEAGGYAVAYRFLDSLLMLPGAFAAAVLPILARRSGRRDALVSAGDQCLRAVVIGVTPVVVAGFLLAPQLVRLVGGATYASSVDVLRVLLIGGWFSSVNIVLGLLIIVSGMQGRMLWLNVGALAVNVVGNLVLIPALGSLGAAVMTTVCEAAVLVVAAYALRRRLGLSHTAQDWTPVLVGVTALLGVAVLSGLALPAMVGVVLSIGVYAGVLLRSGALASVILRPAAAAQQEPVRS